MPYNSAALHPSAEALADTRPKGVVYSAMLAHTLRHMRENGVRAVCLDIDFRLAGPSFDQFLGRAAHVQYLLDQDFVERLVCTYRRHFALDEATEEVGEALGATHKRSADATSSFSSDSWAPRATARAPPQGKAMRFSA